MIVEFIINKQTLKELERETGCKYFTHRFNPVQAPKTPHNQREKQPGVIDMPNNKNPLKRKKKAFTVVELLFVVAILGIITTISASFFDDIEKEIDETINKVEQYHEIVEEYANK